MKPVEYALVLLFLLFIIMTLPACTGSKPRPVEIHQDSAIICPDAPKADPIVMREVKFTYVTGYIAMTAKDYENLSLNMQDIIKHIKQKNSVIEYYQGCVKK